MKNNKLTITKNETKALDDGELSQISIKIDNYVGNYVRQFMEDIDKAILKQMSRDGLLKVISECQKELQRRYENNENY